MNLTIDHEPISSNGRLRARITARMDGLAVWMDTIDLSAAAQRQRFAQQTAAHANIDAAAVERALLAMTERQSQQPAAENVVREAPNDPHRLARACIDSLWRLEDGSLRLAYWRDEFWEWNDVAYRRLGDKQFHSVVTDLLKQEVDRLAEAGCADKEGYRLKVTRQIVADVVQAIAGIVQVDDALEQPAWLDMDAPAAAQNLLAMSGGVIDVMAFCENRECFHPATPNFFTANGLNYEFEPCAECPAWHTFLEQIWPNDPEAIGLLQEFAGYTLLPDTSQQKILLMHGPKRSGKGTVVRVLGELIGRSNVVGPTLKSLQGEFGLQPWLGKLVAVIADARLSGRHDAAAIVETLLSISGEDTVTVNRKNRSMVTTKLPTRIIIVSNELPNLHDASGALAGRLLILRLTRSWYGHEDTTLTDRLLQELPGILIWAIEGLRRLRQRGRFQQPASARQLMSQMERLSSPIAAFVADRCKVEPGAHVTRRAIYTSWCDWCVSNSIKQPGTDASFGRDLRAFLPEIEDSHPTISGQRAWCYQGIRLLACNEPHNSHDGSLA